MNNIEVSTNKQCFAVKSGKTLKQDLRQAIRIINADYQQIDWEDQSFLNRVLMDALKNLEAKEDF